jgi:predicted AlkP superfamily pyrophosphatase or phosphodiesterase
MPRRRTRFWPWLAIGLAGCLGCARGPESAPPAPVTADGPRLLVLIAVDQFPYEYLARFDSLFTGGLRRLLDQGVLFENARYGHAVTVTAAGHTTIASGLHPSSSGIVDNYWYDRVKRQQVNGFDDPTHGRSPVNFLGTALPDWLKGGVDPGARVYAVSGKDRAAIAMGGHRPDGAFWYDDDDGGFESSTYYSAKLPDWVKAWNGQRRAERWFAKAYEPLPEVTQSVEALGLQVVDEGVLTQRYPIAFGGNAIAPDEGFFEALGNSPLLDDLVLSFARTIIERQELGRRDHLDYLAISLSALDLAGHRFGPQSPQVADTLLRLDLELGDFMSFLDRTVGPDRVLIALTSDHGVAPVPELRAAAGLPGRRPQVGDDLCFQQAGERVRTRFNLDRWVHDGFYLDRTAIQAAGADPAEVATAAARELETCDLVRHVWTRAELEASPPDDPDPFRALYRHSFHPDRSADLMVQLVEYAIPGGGAIANHGSPYDYDRHVPVFLFGPGLGTARVSDEIGVVDLAPTLAGLLGIATPKVDGHDLTGLLLERVPGAHRVPAFGSDRLTPEPSAAVPQGGS